MPPRLNSRFTFSSGLTDSSGRLFLTDRVPFRYRAFSDNRQYTVRAGDTLRNIAARFFSPLNSSQFGVTSSAALWWIIADFQPDPVFDPTIALDVGRTLVIPSIRTVTEEILSERRRLTT